MGSVVGIDIGATGVRAVEVAAQGKSLQVRRAGAVPLAPGAVVGGAIKDVAAVTTALKLLYRKNRFSTRKVATVVGADPNVLIRPAQIAHAKSDTDMAALALAAANEVLPVDVNSQYVGHHVVGVTTKHNEDGSAVPMAEIALVSADRAVIDALVKAVEDAGLIPTSIDAEAFALSRFVNKASSGPNRIDVIAHIGAHTIDVIGVTDGQPAFQRSMHEFAGDRVTDAITDYLQVPRDDAEDIKTGKKQVSDMDRASVNEVMSVWTSATVNAIRQVVTEAAKSRNLTVGRVWLSGGGAQLGTLAAHLNAVIGGGAKVTVLDPTTWLAKPEKLVKVTEATKQDFTLALAAGSR